MARSAHREAVGYFEQALSALAHLPETRDTNTLAIDLRLALRTALFPSGNSGRILAALREAEALAAALDDPRRLGQVSIFLTIHFYNRGAHDQAIAAAQRALAAVSGRVSCTRWPTSTWAESMRPMVTIARPSTASGRPWCSAMGRGTTSVSVKSSRPP